MTKGGFKREPRSAATSSDVEAYKFSISLPSEYEAKLAVDVKTRLPLGAWVHALAPLAVARYGGTLKNSTSRIFRLALDELWRRRDEPAKTDDDQLDKYGIAGVIADFDEHDFTDIIWNAEKLALVTNDFAKFLSRSKHKPALMRRFQKGMDTKVFIRAAFPKINYVTRTFEKVTIFKENEDALFSFFSSLPKDRVLEYFALDYVARRKRNRTMAMPPFRILGVSVVHPEAHLKLLHTESVAYAALMYGPENMSCPATIYKPAVNPTSLTEPTVIYTESGGHPGTINMPSVDFHARYALTIDILTKFSSHIDFLPRWWSANKNAILASR